MRKFCLQILGTGFIIFFSTRYVTAQCPVGYTQSQVNWDNLDYLVTSGNYSGFVSTAIASNQHFMMGTTRVSITAPATSINLSGENATHMGELAGYTGQDVQFTPAVNYDTIFISFEQEVTNISFALYDIDNLGSFRILANDNTGASLNASITVQASTVLSLGGIPTEPTVGTTNSTNLGTNSNQGSAIISVTGPVSVIKIVILNLGNDPVFWMSDIRGCVSGSFPNDWRNISRPFTGMPSYILTVVDNKFMMLNPANGRAKLLFTDPAWTNVNGMAYDPLHRALYYTYSLMPSPLTNKTIWKYDLDSETISSLVADVTSSLGIPTYDQGVEFGAASFYNGYYYFGVESSNPERTSGRENTVWRIEFDGAQNPTKATQVYATRSDSTVSGTATLIHDWSDIGVSNNAMMYDFDGATGYPKYYHFNLMTGQRTQYTPAAGAISLPQQLAIDWTEKVYNQGNTTIPGASQGFIVPYNYNGTVNTAQNYTVILNGAPLTGNWGDCSEAFRPLCDFGDAPSSYDPDPWSPAVHEIDTALRIGTRLDREWNKTSSLIADADGTDEDGLVYIPVFAPVSANYLAQVSIYNNTGEDATLIAWLDFNGNGIFDAAEASQTQAPISTGKLVQTRYLYWPVAPTPIPNGGYTYLRIRLARASWGMNNTNATGYFEDGETEDFRILVDDYPLSANLLLFHAKVVNNRKVQLDWTTSGKDNITGYEVQRSDDNLNWTVLTTVFARGEESGSYVWEDLRPLPGKGFYRLRLISSSEESRYSDIRTVIIKNRTGDIVLFPNPAKDRATLTIHSMVDAEALISITDISGKVIYRQITPVTKGVNSIGLSAVRWLKSGLYIVRTQIQEEVMIEKLIIQDK